MYDIYGLGNALMDLECEIDDFFLEANDITKGHMTLVDEELQHSRIQLLDGRPFKYASGGSAANTVVAAQYFGCNCYYSCQVADDEYGQRYHQGLVDAGVGTNLNEKLAAGTTGKCLVMVSPDAERTMNTYLGISSELSSDHLDANILAQSRFLYTEGYLVSSEPSLQAALEAQAMAKSTDTEFVFTLSDPSMVMFFRDSIDQILNQGVDLLFCNEEEALTWSETEDLEDACKRLQTVASKFVITLGAKGSLNYDGNQLIQVPGFPVQPIDTNGAGDMFAGAYLYALSKGMQPADCTRFANFAASRIVTHFGPRLAPASYQQTKEAFEAEAATA